MMGGRCPGAFSGTRAGGWRTGVVLCGLGIFAQATPVHRQWRISEFEFEARHASPSYPYNVRLEATFSGPNGETLLVPGFWDGGQMWKIRFTPPSAGSWKFLTGSTRTDTRAPLERFDSGVIRGQEPARRVEVPLGGVDRIFLIVEDGGDDNRYDHASWADACFMGPSGSRIALESLQPESVTQSHGKPGRSRNLLDQPISINGTTYTHGVGTHAHSRLEYSVDPAWNSFQAWAGVEDHVGRRGSVRFRILTEARPASENPDPDPGLDSQSGEFFAEAASGDNPFLRHGGFLRVSSEGSFLTYSDGTPFFWLGDTCWFCPSDFMPLDTSSHPDIPSAYREWIHLRQRQGFSTLHMAFLGEMKGTQPYGNRDGFPDWNPAYWQQADRYIQLANDAGLMPVIGLGWAGRPLTLENWKLLWRHVIARYGAHAVTWLVCGEYNVKGADDRLEDNLDLGQFIKDTDPYGRAMTIHPWAIGVENRKAWDEPWLDIRMIQGGHAELPEAGLYRSLSTLSPRRPLVEGESRYEGIHTFRATDVREAAYRAFQSGACGYTYGSHGLWYPTQNGEDGREDSWGTRTPWWDALRRPGAEHMGILRDIYTSLPWWNLHPQQDLFQFPDRLAGNPGEWTRLYLLADQRASANVERASECRVVEEGKSILLHPSPGPHASLSFPGLNLPELPTGDRIYLALAVGVADHIRRDDPAHSFDGVGMEIRVAGKTVFRETIFEKGWTPIVFDLTSFAPGPVSLEFRSFSGNNSFYDHATFRNPMILRTRGALPESIEPLVCAPPPAPVLVKGIGHDLFILYFPPDPHRGHPFLRAPFSGSQYQAVWRNPRTGDKIDLPDLTASSDQLELPQPPTLEDWVLVMSKIETLNPEK